MQSVTWDVANTNAAPVSCANVNIVLSTDGGNTWQTTLAQQVPNTCLLYTSPSPRDRTRSRMPSSA